MKESHQCPKCNSLRIGYLEDLSEWGPPFYKPGVRRERADLEAFLCGDCGYLETYLKGPATLLEGLPGFRWLSGEEDGPYR